MRMIKTIGTIVTKKILADNNWKQQVLPSTHTTCPVLMASVVFPGSFYSSDTMEIDFVRKYVFCSYN